MRATLTAITLTAWITQAAAWADQQVDGELEQDVVLRALVDELERGQTGLRLEGLERPYFIEYALLDSATASVSARLGAVIGRSEARTRSLRAAVRVGSYELDNTNFSGGSYFGGGAGVALPIDDDYHALRQAIWWATDRQYKGAAEAFEQKKAFMESKLIEDKPPDFSPEPPAVDFEERIDPDIAADRLEEIAVSLSAVFREYPDIQNSGVGIVGGRGNKYLVNSEGTRLRTSGRRFAVTVSATVQADDGMRLADSFTAHARTVAELGDRAELKQRCHQMARRLLEVRKAPKLESYTGPVLFEARPAAAIFNRHFARRFAGGQRRLGGRRSPGDFAKKLDKRILPRFINVVDDPTQETVAGRTALGNYDYDDQGVKAQPVTLVENGRLRALLMSRKPSKEFKNSNGHGRGLYGPRASVGCLIVTATDGAGPEALKQEMLEACRNEDLDYGIRVAALGSTGGGGASRYSGLSGGSRSGSTGNPLVMYKVYTDGREELVRGAQIARIDLRAFKRLLAAGDTLHVRNSGGGTQGRTVAAPALLFEELDLAEIDQDFDKPPILPTPLAR